jgi:hypothetical protein
MLPARPDSTRGLLVIGVDLVPERAVILPVLGISLRAVASGHVAVRLGDHQDIVVRGGIFLPLRLRGIAYIGISGPREVRPPYDKLIGKALLRIVQQMRRALAAMEQRKQIEQLRGVEGARRIARLGQVARRSLVVE